MAVSDTELTQAWRQVLSLSELKPGQIVTVLTGADSHPQTVRTAIAAASELGARVNRLDLPPVNGEKALSRDSLAYLGTTPLTGNTAQYGQDFKTAAEIALKDFNASGKIKVPVEIIFEDSRSDAKEGVAGAEMPDFMGHRDVLLARMFAPEANRLASGAKDGEKAERSL